MRYLCIFFLFSMWCIILAINPDEVRKLPGVSFALNYKQYSGYLNATSGKFLHYWFVESQRSPSTDPVLLWMNGGPGCSSLDGFLTELGPLHVSADGKSLYNNIFSWNREANVIFLEAPAGVGFSYANNKNYSTDDDATSYDNYVALQHFFQKFPEFKKNEFYITGESYAGIYIPTLSVRVLTGSAHINFKGFAIGNGYLDVAILTNSLVFFAYYHGLIGETLWERLSKYCCGGQATQESCNFANSNSHECIGAVADVTDVVYDSGFNVYDLYSECYHSDKKVSRYSVDKRNLLRSMPRLLGNTLQSKKLQLKHNLKHSIPCSDSSSITKYLNQPSVRKALHIPPHVQAWEVCSSAVEYGYQQIYYTMRPQLLQLINSGKLRGLIYNGDVDMVCNFLGDEWFSYNLGFKATAHYRPWNYDGQVGGFVKQFGELAFLTIRGSGHMVPQDRPGPAFKMISSFLNNRPY